MPKCYIRDYPRPQMVRKNFVLLNGRWKFAFDPQNYGEKKGWIKGIPTSSEIEVPFSPESVKSGICDLTNNKIIWYCREYQFPHSSEERVYLIFEGVDYFADLWVNGQFIGNHRGGYSRFSFDITDSLDNNGNAMIVLRARDGFSKEILRGKQRWKNEVYDCWYTQTTGIWKNVWAETISCENIQDIQIIPSFDDGTVEFGISLLHNEDATPLVLQTIISFDSVEIYCGSDIIKTNYLKKTVALHNSHFKWDVQTWIPEHPNLYDVEFILYKDKQEIDRVGSYFGLRKITTAGGRICLNNQQTYLRMVLDQGYWKDSLLTPPDEDSIISDLKKIKDYGYNGVRKHQKIEDERFYYWADVLGLFVWCECPSAYSFTERMNSNITIEWLNIIKQNQNHPSIIVWVLFNESWGVPKIYSSEQQQNLTKALYYLTKTLDPTRLVVSNDGWEHTCSDIVSLHDYAEDYTTLRKHLEKINSILQNRDTLNGEKFAFSCNHRYEGQPIILSEFGGIAFGTAKGWGYGKTEDNDLGYLARLKGLFAAIYESDILCGFCFTQLTDVIQEVNGHMTMERQDKKSPDIIRNIITGKQTLCE